MAVFFEKTPFFEDRSLVEHKKFGKIPRLGNLNVVITEKLDGTNGVVWVSPDKSLLHAGSRNKWLTENDDNAGFYKFCTENAEALLRLDPGYHYGEFVGPGIQKNRYGLAEKQFFLFDTRLEERYADHPCIHTVPLIDTATFDNIKVPERGTLSKIGLSIVEGYMLYIPQLHQYIKIVYDK